MAASMTWLSVRPPGGRRSRGGPAWSRSHLPHCPDLSAGPLMPGRRRGVADCRHECVGGSKPEQYAGVVGHAQAIGDPSKYLDVGDLALPRAAYQLEMSDRSLTEHRVMCLLGPVTVELSTDQSTVIDYLAGFYPITASGAASAPGAVGTGHSFWETMRRLNPAGAGWAGAGWAWCSAWLPSVPQRPVVGMPGRSRSCMASWLI